MILELENVNNLTEDELVEFAGQHGCTVEHITSFGHISGQVTVGFEGEEEDLLELQTAWDALVSE